MKAVGLITEYNPFHNGHLYHLRQSRLQSEADCCVAVMSGHFLQRGEPALIDKWLRAQMALDAGVDLLVELPLPWACNSAPAFADGAVFCLQQLQVDAICFGSESGSLSELQRAAGWLFDHADNIELESKKLLRQGKTWPQARSIVAAQSAADPAIQEALKHPNNILGLEYLRALSETDASIAPSTIRRIGAGYHDESVVNDLASATGIRMRVAKHEPVGAFLPDAASSILTDALQTRMTVDPEILYRLLVYALQQDEKGLESIYQVDSGMGRRLYESSVGATDYTGLVDAVKSRQLTRTRIQRLLSYVLLGLDAGLMKELLDCGPLYLHLLGQSRAGEAFLGERRKQFELPLVSNYSRVHNQLKRHYEGDPERLRLAQEQLRIELRASRVYSLLLPGFGRQNRNRDFYQSVIRID
jgi:predicted nucleotidyltransferase